MFFLFKNNRIKHLAFILALFVSASLLAQEPLNAKKQQKFDAAFFEAERFKVIEDFDQAILKYEECLKISPNHPVVLYELAGLYFIDNRNEVALNSASKAVQLDSLNAWYRLRLIKILQVEGNRAEVINQQKILIDQNPNRLDFIFQLAETYLIDLQYQNCIDLLTEAERLEGITEDKSTRKRDMYLLLNDADKAREEIEKLVEAFPTNVNYLGQLANFYSDYGPEQKVEPTYLKLIEMAPEDPRAYLNLASYYRETGRNEESIFYLKSALVNPNLNIDAKISVLMSLYNLDPKDTAMSSLSYALLDSTLKAHPEDPKIYTVYSDFLVRDGKDKEALTYLRKAVKLGATQRQILEQLILLDMEAQDFEAMSKDAEMAMEYYPNQPFGYLMSGTALSLLEKYEEATEVLESGVIYVIKNPQLKEQFYIQLAEAYNYLEDYSSSDLNFNNALSINPKNPTTLNNYAYYLALREDQLDKAKELAERCNELVPNNAVFLDTYAWVMYKKGDYSKAFSLMEKVMSINKNPQSDVLEHMGDILYRLNRKEEAFEYWNQAKEKGEGSEFLNKKIKNQKLYE